MGLEREFIFGRFFNIGIKDVFGFFNNGNYGMETYWFLFLLAGIVTIIAIIQDMKKREVANWLNFSFIGIGLAYRAFYSISNFGVDRGRFFVLGLLGFIFMFVLAYALYYSRAFAGGDAKLLMGFGTVLPYWDYWSVILLGVAFIFLLFLLGLVWSLAYSLYVVCKNMKGFKKELGKSWRSYRLLVLLSLVTFFVLVLTLGEIGKTFGFLILILSLLWVYVKSLDKVFIVSRGKGELQEGDWLLEDIKINGRTIKESVHGLSLEEIGYLKKNLGKKKIKIKDGIPFTPAFLLALLFGILI